MAISTPPKLEGVNVAELIEAGLNRKANTKDKTITGTRNLTNVKMERKPPTFLTPERLSEKNSRRKTKATATPNGERLLPLEEASGEYRKERACADATASSAE